MKNPLLGVLGVLLNSIGLCIFGDAIIHRAMAGGAAASGLLDGLLGLILINGGILLMIAGFQRRNGL